MLLGVRCVLCVGLMERMNDIDQALAFLMRSTYLGWARGRGAEADLFTALARAATRFYANKGNIKAMRHPTDAMVNAAHKLTPGSRPDLVWMTMVDAAPATDLVDAQELEGAPI